MAKMFKLRNQLLDSFSEAELDDLCFELNIIYSDLPGVNRPAKYDLQSAGDDLWQTVSRENIFKFSVTTQAHEKKFNF